MRALPEHDALEILHRVRAGVDAAAIVNTVKDGNLLLQLHLVPETRLQYDLPHSRDIPAWLLTSGSPYLDSTVYEAAALHIQQPRVNPSRATMPGIGDSFHSQYGSEYLRPYHAAVLVEPRLQNVKPSEWSMVSKDDTLMRDLLTAYFTHEYHLWPVFQKDYFLEDMARARTANMKTPCCSSLLVNAVLAFGCVSRKSPSLNDFPDLTHIIVLL